MAGRRRTGKASRNAPHTPSYDCVPYPKGGGFSTTNEKAVTWSGGLSVAQFGFNAEAQTGYDSSAQLNFSFDADRKICGTNATPPYAAQVVAKR